MKLYKNTANKIFITYNGNFIYLYEKKKSNTQLAFSFLQNCLHLALNFIALIHFIIEFGTLLSTGGIFLDVKVSLQIIQCTRSMNTFSYFIIKKQPLCLFIIIIINNYPDFQQRRVCSTLENHGFKTLLVLKLLS